MRGQQASAAVESILFLTIQTRKMQFEGLKGLLKKSKKAAPSQTPAETSSTTTPSAPSPSPESATDPYAAALLKAQQVQRQKQEQRERNDQPARLGGENRKRSRESSTERAGGITSTEAFLEERGNSRREDPSNDVASAAEAGVGVAPSLKTPEAVTAEQLQSSAALQTCQTDLEVYWKAGKNPASISSEVDAPSASLSSPVPQTVGRYLLQWFVQDNRLTPATGEPEMALLDREFALLASLHTAETEPTSDGLACGASSNTQPEPPLEAHGAALRQLGETVRVLWYLIALRWQYSIDPHARARSAQTKPKAAVVASSASSGQGLSPEQHGWSPFVYLGLKNALPADVRLTLGRAVAQEIDQWRSLTRTRQYALELLAYLYSDYQTMRAVSSSSATAAASCIVPADLRDALHVMLVQHLQRERNFMAVRQDYVDVTMGTANWKLGLFSGGEVHMRRSMERVERNRISHLLNNEHATHLLQSVRELTTFAEQHKAHLAGKFFFA